MAQRRSTDKGRNLFRDLQNRVRGVVGATRAKGFEKVPREVALHARVRLKRIVTEGQKLLGPQQYEKFLNWSTQHTKAQAPALEKAPYRYDELGDLKQKKTSSLENEISSVCARLFLAADVLRDFRALAELLEHAFWRHDIQLAEDVLTEIEEIFGQTLWLIEAQIAFKQFNHGLDIQKRFAQEISAKTRRGIASYFAFFISVKNEPTVTLQRFSLSDIATRLSRTPKLSLSAKHYFNVRLGDNWPTTNSGLASVLQIEQTTSLIDLFETFIRIAQRLVSTGPDSSVADALRRGLLKLDVIGDFRISKCSFYSIRRYQIRRRFHVYL